MAASDAEKYDETTAVVLSKDTISPNVLQSDTVKKQTSSQKTQVKRWKSVILDDDEYVVKVFYTSFLTKLLLWLSGAFTLMFLIAVLPVKNSRFVSLIAGMMVSMGMLVHWWFTRRFAWAATNHRVISRLGFLSKQGTSISYNRVTDIDVHHPFMCWLFGNGEVLVNTAAGSGDNLTIYGQRDPNRVESEIRKYASKAQEETGPTETATGYDNDNDMMTLTPSVNLSQSESNEEKQESSVASENSPLNTSTLAAQGVYPGDFGYNNAGYNNMGQPVSKNYMGMSNYQSKDIYMPAMQSPYAAHMVGMEQSEDRFSMARWFMEKVWTPNDVPTFAQLRRVHYRYLQNHHDLRLRHDGVLYHNTLSDWQYLQQAASEAQRMGWIAGLVPMLGDDVPVSAPQYYGFGEMDARLVVWLEHSGINDILLPLCEDLALNCVSNVASLSFASLIKFATRTYASGTAIMYLSNYDPRFDPVPIDVLEQQIKAAGVKVRIARLLLTERHVDRYGLPTVPSYAKEDASDIHEKVEMAALEAIRPGEISRLLVQAVENYRQRLSAAVSSHSKPY